MINLRTSQQRAREAAIQDRILVSYERATSSRLRAEFNRFAVELADVFTKTAGDTQAAIQNPLISHASHLQRILSASTRDVMTVFGGRVIESAGKSLSARERKDSFGELDEAIRDWISQYVGNRVTAIAATTEAVATRVIQDIVATAIQEGLSNAEISRRIRNDFASLSRPRASTIARTELHGAAQYASVSGAESLSIDLVKVWNTSEDDRVRATHREVNEDKAPMKEPFKVGSSSLQFPGDPAGDAADVINCRCVLTYEEAAQ